jgi:hypothetical protein
MVYKDNLERIHRELIERQTDLLLELQQLPEGELMCTYQKGSRRYMQRIPATGNRKKEHRYGIKKKPEILRGLVRKEYVEKALKKIDGDLKAIETAIKKYRPIDENSVMEEFVGKYSELADYIYRDKIDEEEWTSRFSRIEGYHKENLKDTAADGTPMRSKNEVYISSRLDHYGLTYRSDCPTGIPGLYRIPDFTIIRKRDGKVIYWEHMGMMYDLENRIDNKRKLEEYERAGIVPWENLIITYDTRDGGIRGELIEAMIKGWLL